MAKFTCCVYLTKQTPTGYNYRLVLRHWEAVDSQAARGMAAISAKDEYPEHGVQEVLVVSSDLPAHNVDPDAGADVPVAPHFSPI